MKKPFLLALILIGFASFAFWYQYQQQPRQKADENNAKRALQLSVDSSISMIKVRGDKGVVELTCSTLCSLKEMGSWKVGTSEANPGAVKALILNATSTGEVMDLTNESPDKRKALLEQYGLSETQLSKEDSRSIEVVLKGMSAHQNVWFGSDYPLGNKTYVGSGADGKLNDQKIFLMDSEFKNALFSHGFDDFLLTPSTK